MTPNDRAESVKNEIQKIVEGIGKVEALVNWVRCPICSEEWTKLAPCRYFLDAGGKNQKPVVTYACVQCAESTWKFKDIAGRWPMALGNEGLIFERRLPPAFKNISLDQITPGMWIATVGLSDTYIFQIQSRNTGIVISGTGIKPEEPVFVQNSIAAWFWLKNRFEKGEPKTDGEDWQ